MDADPKAIYQIEFVAQLKKLDANYNVRDACNDQPMFILAISEKFQKNEFMFSQGSVTVI